MQASPRPQRAIGAIASLALSCILILGPMAGGAAADGSAQSDDASIQSIRFVSESWEGITNADGTGLCWELFRKVYEPEGIGVTFEIVPYARATHMVRNQMADASVGAYLNEYDKALFGKWHYLRDVVLVIYKKGKTEAWKGEQSLTGQIGWMRGYAFDEYIEKEIPFIEMDERKTALKMLAAGRLDFFIDTASELEAALETGIIDPKDYQVQTLLNLDVYLAFAENDRGRRLLRIFNERMENLVASGELRPLYEKWKLRYPF